MTWKNYPTWLKGGIIALIPCILVIILFFVIGLIGGFTHNEALIIPFLFFFPAMIIIRLLFEGQTLGVFLSSTLHLLLGTLIYFLIGCFIGLVKKD